MTQHKPYPAESKECLLLLSVSVFALWILKFICNDKNVLQLWRRAKLALQVPFLAHCAEKKSYRYFDLSSLMALHVHGGHRVLICATLLFTNFLWNSWLEWSWQILQYHAEYTSRDIFAGFKIVLNIFMLLHSSQIVGAKILLNPWRLLERDVVLRPNPIILQGNGMY